MKLHTETAMGVLRELGCDGDFVEFFNENAECPECGNQKDSDWEEEQFYYILEETYNDNADEIRIRFHSEDEYGDRLYVEGTISDYIVEQLGYISETKAV